MKKLFILPVLLAMACGCTSVDIYREGVVDGLEYPDADSYDAWRINWDVGKERVKGTGSSTCWFWFFTINDGRHMNPPGFSFGGVRTAKESATFDAVESAKADTLVGAAYRYTFTSRWLGICKEVNCEVLGFPAFVKGIDRLEDDRPVLIEKDQQVIRVKKWETLEKPGAGKFALPKLGLW